MQSERGIHLESLHIMRRIVRRRFSKFQSISPWIIGVKATNIAYGIVPDAVNPCFFQNAVQIGYVADS